MRPRGKGVGRPRGKGVGRRVSDVRRGNREQGDTDGDGEVSCGARNEGQGVGRLAGYLLAAMGRLHEPLN